LTYGRASDFQGSLAPPSAKNFSGGKTVYVENYGCAANKFDFEVMLAHLMSAGYRFTDGASSADVIMINTCGVKKPTEDRIIGKIRVLSQLNKPLIIAGCLPKINFKAVLKAAPGFAAALDPRSVDKILLAVKSAESGAKNKIFFSQKPIHKLRQPKIRLNPSIEVISISEGCAGACAFCCVRFARGVLFSYPKEDVVKRVSQAVSEGVREIWLTSQDNGAYGLDIKTNLAELLEDCCRAGGKFLIRVGMMNPNHVLRMLPELIDAYKDEKIFKFLHLPVQSGDNGTLMRMNRRYTVDEFKKIVHKFGEEIPETTLSTDVICGFPGESRQAFEKTLKIVEEVQPDIVNISKFFSRPKTPAMKMRHLDPNEVKDRSRKLTKLVRKVSLNRNRKWLNWAGEVLVDERGKGSSWIGRNFAYKPIVIKSCENLFGRFVRAKVARVYSTYLEAELV
jgi:MiaB-like tRNA modifying enzyme